MLWLTFWMGMLCRTTEGVPISIFSIEQPEQSTQYFPIHSELLQHPWSTSLKDIQRLWELYWLSRLGILPEDPDIFEGSLSQLLHLSQAEPGPFLENSKVILPNVLWTVTKHRLEKEYNSLETQSIEHIKQAYLKDLTLLLTEHTEEQMDTWFNCWKTPKGSIGFELYRAGLLSVANHIGPNNPIHHTLMEDWNLEGKPPVPICPSFVPGQVEDQPIPEEPELHIVQYHPSSLQAFWQRVQIHLFQKQRGIYSLLLLTILAAYKAVRIRKPLFSLSILLSIELLTRLITPPLSDRTALLQTQNQNLEPLLDVGGAYITQGDYLRAQIFQKQKSRKRLLLLGASSVHGSNELWQDSFAGRLQESSGWEIVNLGIGGINSFGLKTLLPSIELLSPDAVVLYYGHNEWHQLRQTEHQHFPSVSWLWVQKTLWHSSTYTLLHQTLHRHISRDRKEHPLASFELEKVRAQRLEFARSSFSENLSTLLDQLHSIPVLLINPPTNYPFAPMEYVTSLPPTIAEVQALIDASNESTTIHSSIRAEIPKLAKKYGTRYWDLDEHFHRHSPDTTSSNGLFWDELHPSALGHQWIANGLTHWLQTIEQE